MKQFCCKKEDLIVTHLKPQQALNESPPARPHHHNLIVLKHSHGAIDAME
jgi:hypothetical protein